MKCDRAEIAFGIAVHTRYSKSGRINELTPAFRLTVF